MDRRFLYGGLLVVAGVGLVRALAGRAPHIQAGETRLLLVGDSLAVGLSTPFKDMAQKSNVAFASLAKVGTRMDQWAKNADLTTALTTFQPTLILVSLGTNDASMLPASAMSIATPALTTLLARLRATGAEVVWIGPPTLPAAKSPQVLDLIRSTLDKKHSFPSEQLVIPRGPDQLHPALKGYVGWAELVWKWLT